MWPSKKKLRFLGQNLNCPSVVTYFSNTDVLATFTYRMFDLWIIKLWNKGYVRQKVSVVFVFIIIFFDSLLPYRWICRFVCGSPSTAKWSRIKFVNATINDSFRSRNSFPLSFPHYHCLNRLDNTLNFFKDTNYVKSSSATVRITLIALCFGLWIKFC